MLSCRWNLGSCLVIIQVKIWLGSQDNSPPLTSYAVGCVLTTSNQRLGSKAYMKDIAPLALICTQREESTLLKCQQCFLLHLGVPAVLLSKVQLFRSGPVT